MKSMLICKFEMNYIFRSKKITFLFLFSIAAIIFENASATQLQMRVVKETSNYGYFGANAGENENSNRLVASVPPANVSGPQLLHKLLGKCFNLTQDGYLYTFCPFQNFTQYEISPKWDAYQGILGIWSHWDIENNTFSRMVHSNGDHCGDVDRSVKVSVQCGEKNRLLNVSEPTKCQYLGVFETHYVCHSDALLVYPRLNPLLQREWDAIYTEMHYGVITKKGYEANLKKILQKAGLMEQPTTPTTESSVTVTATFANLQQCDKEYKNLQNEVSSLRMELDALKLLIDLSKIEKRTAKPHR